MTKRHLLGLPLGVLGMCIVIALALSMTGTQPTPTDGNGNPLNEATLQDMKAIADAEDISYQAAVDSYAWHDDFAWMVSDIREDAPDGFSAGGISGDNAAWIAFSGAATDGASGHVQQFQEKYPNITVEFITGTGFSEDQSQTALRAAHYAVFMSPSVVDASTSFDFQTKRINITANLGTDSPPDSLVPSLKQDAEAAVAEAAGPEILDLISVEVAGVNFATSEAEHDSKHYGGERLSHCSSGFAVVDSSGTRGITTAAHCANAITDDGDDLTFKRQHRGSHGDIQWHTGPETVSNKFYSGRSNAFEVHLRSVIRTNTPVYNQRLCRNGKTSNRDCQRVRKVSVCASYLCNLTQMNAHLSASGDSGGPVFSSNTAYGIHQGIMYEPPNPTAREVFTRLDEIYDAIEVDILTER